MDNGCDPQRELEELQGKYDSILLEYRRIVDIVNWCEESGEVDSISISQCSDDPQDGDCWIVSPGQEWGDTLVGALLNAKRAIEEKW